MFLAISPEFLTAAAGLLLALATYLNARHYDRRRK